MNTPDVHTVMPGDRFMGPDPEGVMTRDQFVALLEDFAARNRLPIELDTPVVELSAAGNNSLRPEWRSTDGLRMLFEQLGR